MARRLPTRKEKNDILQENKHQKIRLIMLLCCIMTMFNLRILLSEYNLQQLQGMDSSASSSSFGILPTTIVSINTRDSSSLSSSPLLPKKRATVVVCKEDVNLDIGMVYRSLLPYLFPSNLYETRVVETDKANLPANESTADVLLCLGYFYSQNYTLQKQEIGKKLGHIPINHGQDVTQNISDVYWPTTQNTIIVPHREGRPFQFSFQSEAWDQGRCRYDIMIVSTDPNRKMFDGCPLYFWPYYATSFFRREGWPHILTTKLQNQPTKTQAADILKSKTDFCAFVVSQCWHPTYKNNDVMVRPAFYDVLSERMREIMNTTTTNTNTGSQQQQQQQAIVKGYGKCRNTEDRALVYKTEGGYYRDTDDVVEMYRKFRFALVFENNAVPGYVTEKIMNALLADTIPIFWGTPDIAKFVNMDRIVHCDIEGTEGLQKFRDIPKPKTFMDAESVIKRGHVLLKDAFAPCIDEIIELENNPEKYIWKLSQPILPGDGKVEGSYFDLEKVGREMRTVISAFDSPLVPLDHSFNRTIPIAS